GSDALADRADALAAAFSRLARHGLSDAAGGARRAVVCETAHGDAGVRLRALAVHGEDRAAAEIPRCAGALPHAAAEVAVVLTGVSVPRRRIFESVPAGADAQRHRVDRGAVRRLRDRSGEALQRRRQLRLIRPPGAQRRTSL